MKMMKMVDPKRKPPPLPIRRKAHATVEVEPEQIVSEEEPSLEDLAERFIQLGRTPRRTQEVDEAQILGEEHDDAAIYELAVAEVPWDLLEQDEGMLLSIIDGRRDVGALASISGLGRDKAWRILEALSLRELITRCG
jgi:hypothetical protein